jgi:hypothetical protein
MNTTSFEDASTDLVLFCQRKEVFESEITTLLAKIANMKSLVGNMNAALKDFK